jgi:hypothetical protein
MSKVKKIMVLDVEGMNTARPYNVGYIIADTKGNVIEKRSFALLACVWENLQNCLCAKAMTHKNCQEILEDENELKYKKVTITDFKTAFENDIEKYGIKEIWAYNCGFDKNSIHRLYGDDFERLTEKVCFYDIWSAIIYTRLVNKKYVKYCRENDTEEYRMLTDCGNCKTTAEIVYGYLFNKKDFVEEHTGLADCLIEYKIYLKAKSAKKKMKQMYAPWKMIKKFCEEKGI